MSSLNKAILIGNIGKDFELRKTAAGSSIATLSSKSLTRSSRVLETVLSDINISSYRGWLKKD